MDGNLANPIPRSLWSLYRHTHRYGRRSLTSGTCQVQIVIAASFLLERIKVRLLEATHCYGKIGAYPKESGSLNL